MKSIPKISDAEWQVMKVLWKKAPCTAQVMIDALTDPRAWTSATIKTLINRLLKKGAVRYQKDGRSYVYSPVFSEAELRQVETTCFIDRVFDGALSPLLAHFTERGRTLSAEDISALEKLLRESRKKP